MKDIGNIFSTKKLQLEEIRIVDFIQILKTIVRCVKKKGFWQNWHFKHLFNSCYKAAENKGGGGSKDVL